MLKLYYKCKKCWRKYTEDGNEEHLGTCPSCLHENWPYKCRTRNDGH